MYIYFQLMEDSLCIFLILTIGFLVFFFFNFYCCISKCGFSTVFINFFYYFFFTFFAFNNFTSKFYYLVFWTFWNLYWLCSVVFVEYRWRAESSKNRIIFRKLVFKLVIRSTWKEHRQTSSHFVFFYFSWNSIFRFFFLSFFLIVKLR